MANRSITVTLRANVQDFKSQFDAATKAAEQTAKATEQSAQRADTAMGRMAQSAQNNRQAWDTAGTTLTAFGAATLGGLGLATKAAMDWESAWAGVTKTVEGTPAQLAEIEAGLRGMARELPASHQEIAAVAEAAGALGVETGSILRFTETMINLGETTNLTSDQAATSLARFMNIMGTSTDDIERLGSTLVGLGNSGASTEQEIMELGLRLSGAGAQANLSEGEILGMANALSSVGIEAEAGGTAMSTTMKRIGKAVDEGGDSLELFAQVAGLSADEFATMWETRPAEAMSTFVEGLSRTEQMGMSTNAVLTELGITGIRESDALLRMSSAGDILATSMAQGNEEFEKGNALIEEAAKRYETAESRIQLAKNALVDAGISIGSVVLPAFADLADGIADAAGWFADLPAPVHATIAGLGGVAGAASLGAGAFLLVTPRVLDTVSAFRDLGAISPATASKVGRTTLAIGKIGLAAGAAAAVFPLLVSAGREVEDALRGVDDATRNLGMNELTSKLLDAADSGDAFTAVMGDMFESGAINTTQFENLGEAVQKVSRLDTDLFARTGKSLNLTTGYLRDAEERLDGLGEALTLMAQTDLPSAQEAFSAFWTEAEAGGASLEEVFRVLPGFRDALAGVALEMGVGTDDATLLKIATGELSPVVDEATGAVTGLAEGVEGAGEGMQSAAEAAADLYDKMSSVANGFLTARGAARDYNDALDEASDAIEEHGKKWDEQSEAGDALGASIDGVAESILANADAMVQNGESTGAYLSEQRGVLIDLAKEMGATQEQAEEYVNALGLTPEYISTQVELDTQQAIEDWAALWEELGYHPPQLPVGADTSWAEGDVTEFSGLLSDQPPTDMGVGADTTPGEADVAEFSGLVGDTRPPDVPVGANIQPGMTELYNLETSIAVAGGTVTINGNATPGDQVLDTLMGVINSSGGTVTIDGQKYPAEQALSAAIRAINDGRGVVEIDGDNSGAYSATNSAVSHGNRAHSTIKVGAATSAANSAINNAARDRYSTIRVSYSVRGGVPSMNVGGRQATARAMGGPVFGPGTETSDSIHAKLSHNEHVWAAREVKAAGGHASVGNIRAQILAGAKTIHLATGGAADGSVGAVRYAPAYQQVRAQNVSASVDSGAIASAVAGAMSGWQPVVKIGRREFTGLMVQGKQDARAYGGSA